MEGLLSTGPTPSSLALEDMTDASKNTKKTRKNLEKLRKILEKKRKKIKKKIEFESN